MKLSAHCQKVKKQLENDDLENTIEFSDDKYHEEILKIINKHHIPFTALRIYAAIYIYMASQKKGIRLKDLHKILIEEDMVTQSDIDINISKLMDQKIIKFDGDRYIL